MIVENDNKTLKRICIGDKLFINLYHKQNNFVALKMTLEKIYTPFKAGQKGEGFISSVIYISKLDQSNRMSSLDRCILLKPKD